MFVDKVAPELQGPAGGRGVIIDFSRIVLVEILTTIGQDESLEYPVDVTILHGQHQAVPYRSVVAFLYQFFARCHQFVPIFWQVVRIESYFTELLGVNIQKR